MTKFEFQPKTKSITIRIPGPLLKEVKEFAKKSKVKSYQKLIRFAIEEFLDRGYYFKENYQRKYKWINHSKNK